MANIQIYLQSLPSDLGASAIDAVTLQASPNKGAQQGQAAGSTFLSLITNTQTNPAGFVQCTQSAGGSVVCWVTPPIAGPLAGFTYSNVSNLTNIRASVSNVAANAALGFKVTRWSAGVETQLNVSNTTGTALTATDANTTFTANGSGGLTMAVGDRYVIRLYICNVIALQMVAGYTVSVSFDGQKTGSAGDSYYTFSQSEVFRASLAQGTRSATPPASISGRMGAFGAMTRPTRKSRRSFSYGDSG